MRIGSVCSGVVSQGLTGFGHIGGHSAVARGVVKVRVKTSHVPKPNNAGVAQKPGVRLFDGTDHLLDGAVPAVRHLALAHNVLKRILLRDPLD
jgi:hypothetical protein